MWPRVRPGVCECAGNEATIRRTPHAEWDPSDNVFVFVLRLFDAHSLLKSGMRVCVVSTMRMYRHEGNVETQEWLCSVGLTRGCSFDAYIVSMLLVGMSGTDGIAVVVVDVHINENEMSAPGFSTIQFSYSFCFQLSAASLRSMWH